jgi:signal transduction histidine kinase
LKYSPPDTSILVTLARDENDVTLQIRDQGIGIPEDDLRHLFEPFHRAANVGTIAGTGLGLNIAKQAVELHGGTITVDSEVGVGTSFTIRIPAARADDLEQQP